MRSGVDCLTAAAPSPSAAHDLLRKDPAPNLARRRLVLPAASREPQGAPRLRSTKPTTPAIGTPRRHPPDLGHRAERQIAALRRPSGLRRRETRSSTAPRLPVGSADISRASPIAGESATAPRAAVGCESLGRLVPPLRHGTRKQRAAEDAEPT